MPRRRNYRQQNYTRGYSQPTATQYQSFFNPIPVEFLQRNLDERQGAYDTAFSGAISAKDQMQQTESAMSDLAYKNELINKGVKDINKIVTDKYGGDWGRASKEVARNITQLRADPFWQTTKYLKGQQDIEQKFKLDNPDAHIYTSPSSVGAIDPLTGKPRSMKELTFRGEEKGQWQQSVGTQFKDVQGDVLIERMKKLTGEGSGYKGVKRISDLTDTQLRALANDEFAVNTFLENNGDFMRSKMEIDGMSEEEVRAAASDFIYGQIKHKKQRVESQQLVKDDEFLLGLKNSVNRGNVWGGEYEGPAFETGYDPEDKKERKKMDRYFSDSGDIVDSDQKYTTSGTTPIGREGAVGNLIAMFNNKDVKDVEKQIYTGEQQVEIKELAGLIRDLRNNNAEAFPNSMSDWEVYETFNNSGEKYKRSITTAVPLLNEDMSQNLGHALNQNLSGTEFYLKGDKISPEMTRNYQGKNGIEEETNIPPEAFESIVTNKANRKGYDITLGMYYTEVPKFKKKDGVVMNSDGTINWSKSGEVEGMARLYYAPDTYTKGASNVVSILDQALKDSSFEGMLPGMSIDQEALQKAKNAGEDVNHAKVISIQTDRLDVKDVSLEDIRHNYHMGQTMRLQQKYAVE
jgi:hypothetical protein